MCNLQTRLGTPPVGPYKNTKMTVSLKVGMLIPSNFARKKQLNSALVFGCCSGVINQESHVYHHEIWDEFTSFVF